MACPHLMDLGAMVTKHMHASVPNASFNGQLKADLRQTPGELQGKPFQPGCSAQLVSIEIRSLAPGPTSS